MEHGHCHCNSKWVLYCFSLVFLQVISGIGCCSEAERLSLLELKAFLNRDGYDADRLLPSWIDRAAALDHNSSSSCCDWERVTCNHSTGRVIELSLDDVRQTYNSPYGHSPKTWFLNFSSFQPFHHLMLLNLSFNNLAGWVPTTHDSVSLLRLAKLEILDLGHNLLGDTIIPSLKGLTSLRSLILAENSFQKFPVIDISRFENREMLELSENRLNGIVAEQDLNPNSSLEILDLSGSGLTSIPSYIGALSSLKALSLNGNKIVGDSSSIQVLCRLKGLEELDLGSNGFVGILPPCLYNLTSLKLLDLSANSFTGEIPWRWIAGLTSLRYIDLRYNDFAGIFSFKTFSNHTQLEVVALGSSAHNHNLTIETEDYSGWIAQFQLKVLHLVNCNLNRFKGITPVNFLLHQKELRILDLSDNNLEGRFPGWLLANNSGLELISIRNNSFTGDFYLPAFPMMNARQLDVSYNQIQGSLPENLGMLFPRLEELNLSTNVFQGKLPSSFGEMKNLRKLDLSYNNFTGEVPSELDCRNLQFLILSNNQFHGEFFSTHNDITGLLVLRLNGNRFTGALSAIKLKQSGFISEWDLSNNNFSGQIFGWISNSMFWFILDMRNNSIQGSVPCQVFSARYVDLSYNLFSGPLPSCSNSPIPPEHIHLQANNLTGSIPEAFLNSSSLLVLNMRDNKLSGTIPDMIGALPNLRILLLGGNQLVGSIPDHLCRLKQMSLLDFSNNNFSGPIPQCFHNITFGKTRAEDEQIALTLLPTVTLPMSIEVRRLLINKDFMYSLPGDISNVFSKVDFVTKRRHSSYQGDILNYMSGLDLSCNRLVGEIPPGLGNFSEIRSLNLSHNQLTGSIPRDFSNLRQIESMDLSHNSLSGEIPSDLTRLTFLAVFSVAYNNLSGKTPDMKAQFGTFENNSYEGNPFLCGPPLEKDCNKPVPPVAFPDEEDHGKWYQVDHVVFFASFAASFAIFFLGVIGVLYANPYLRQWVFYHTEEFMYSSYYFVYDNFLKQLFRLCH